MSDTTSLRPPKSRYVLRASPPDWWLASPWNGLDDPPQVALALFELAAQHRRVNELVAVCKALTSLLSPYEPTSEWVIDRRKHKPKQPPRKEWPGYRPDQT